MDFKLKINCDNDAVVNDVEHCVASALESISFEVMSGRVFGSIRDINGNRIGDWKFTDINGE